MATLELKKYTPCSHKGQNEQSDRCVINDWGKRLDIV